MNNESERDERRGIIMTTIAHADIACVLRMFTTIALWENKRESSEKIRY